MAVRLFENVQLSFGNDNMKFDLTEEKYFSYVGVELDPTFFLTKSHPVKQIADSFLLNLWT